MKQFTKVLVAIALIVGMTSAVQAQSKVAHIHTQNLVDAMPEYKSAQSEIQKLEASYGAEVNSMSEELQKTMERYNREAETQTDEENQRRFAEVQETQSKIQQYQQGAYQKLQEKNQELLKPILEKARTAIQKVAREKGYDFVLDSTPGAGGIIMADGYDLMGDVKSSLGI